MYALAAYLAIALIATWPLAAGLARDVAWDLGDSVLNMWILAWDCEQLLAILRGDFSRIATFFDANIFHPAPLTLAYSEHLLPQAIQILPVYAITGNPILCYNLLFLSTIVLSGLGTYLLVRELTGSAWAGFIAGLLFAFAPYRLPQASHLQVLSAQWMPLALYGMRRYFDSRRVKPLLWSAVAVAVQALSCGYYLLYFSPFVALYAVWEIAQHGLWRQSRVWLQLAGAGLLTAVLVAPFLLPYAEIRNRFDMARSPTEVTQLSADVYSYATAFIGQPLWGRRMEAFPKPEGELFPGVVPVLLALAGLAAAVALARQAQPEPPAPRARWMRIAAPLLSLLALGHLALALAVVVQRRLLVDLGLFELRATDATQLLARATVAFALLLLISPSTRARTAVFLRDRGYFLVGLVLAMWLSLGPAPQVLGRPLDLAAPYGWLYEHVPGFEGVRVPARYAMIAALMLAVLGGYGAAALLQRRWGQGVAVVAAGLFLLEGTQVPFLVNGVSTLTDFNTPEARLYPPDRAPAVYRDGVARIGDGILAELPLGNPDYDLRALYYSTVHWRRILNGYSGFYPAHYARLASVLSEIPRHIELSMQALRDAGATHVLVHEGAYLGNEGEETSAALRTAGAVELYRDGRDVILALPR